MEKKYLTIVECAIEHKGKFLLIERPEGSYASGTLSFPGGKVDPQDEASPYDILRNAVKREVLEEVGLILEDPIQYVTSSYFFVPKNDMHVIDTIFYCKLEKTIAHVIPSPREVPAYYWMSPQEIETAYNAPVWLKQYIKLTETLT